MMKCKTCGNNIYGGRAQTCSEACRELSNSKVRALINSRLSDKSKAMLAGREPWKCKGCTLMFKAPSVTTKFCCNACSCKFKYDIGAQVEKDNFDELDYQNELRDELGLQPITRN